MAFADDYHTHCILQLLPSHSNRKCFTLHSESHATRPEQLLSQCGHRNKLNFSEFEQSMYIHDDVYMLVSLLELLRLLPLGPRTCQNKSVPEKSYHDTLRCNTKHRLDVPWSCSTALFCLFRRDCAPTGPFRALRVQGRVILYYRFCKKLCPFFL